MKEIKNLLFVLIGAVFFIGMYMLCDQYAQDITTEYSSQITPSLLTEGSEESETVSEEDANDLGVEDMVQNMVTDGYSANMTFTAAGDILCQTEILEDAYDSENDSFDFSKYFENVSELFKASDLCAVTLKTTMAGAYNGVSSDIGGYGNDSNCSNSPAVLAQNMKDAGIGLVNMANNHSLDSGASGLLSTMENLSSAGLIYVGTADSETSSDVYEDNLGGLNIAVAGYTNSVNVENDSEEFLINDLDNYDDTKVNAMCEEISKLASTNDLVILMINFGSVNDNTIETDQRKLAEKAVAAGADIIIGTGSRALRPMEQLTETTADGDQNSGLVFYGMGALLTSDAYSSDSGIACDLSAVISFNIARSGVGDTNVISFEVTPIYLCRQESGVDPVQICQVLDTSDYEDEFTEDQLDRMNTGYTEVISQLLDGSGLTSTYENYKYIVTLK